MESRQKGGQVRREWALRTGPLGTLSALRLAYILPLLHHASPVCLALGRQSNTPPQEYQRPITPSRPQISPKPLTSRPPVWLQVLSTRNAAILPGNDKRCVVVSFVSRGRPIGSRETHLPPSGQWRGKERASQPKANQRAGRGLR